MQRSFVVNSPTAPVKYRQLIGNGAESFANGSFPWPVGRTKSREATEIHRSRRSVLRDNNELFFFLFSFLFFFVAEEGRGRSFTKVLELVPERFVTPCVTARGVLAVLLALLRASARDYKV